MSPKVFLKTTGWVVIVGILIWADHVWAAKSAQSTQSAFQNAYNTLHATFVQARSVVYVLSGFGLIGVAVGAIFGKINFKWLAMICIGLAMLAGADNIVNYSTDINAVEKNSDYKGIGEEDFKLDLQWK